MPGLIGEKNVSYPFLNRFSTKTLRQLLQEDFASKEPSTPESDTFTQLGLVHTHTHTHTHTHDLPPQFLG